MDHRNIEKTTLETYELIARDWSLLRDKNFWEEELSLFSELLPTGKVLEVGVWSGRDAKYFLEHGYDYCGFDNSPSFIRIASENNPSWNFRVGDLYDQNFSLECEFDGLWACAVFVHVPKARLPRVLKNCLNRLKNWGIWFISMQAGDGEWMSNRTLPDGTEYGRFFSYYSEKEFLGVLVEQGLEILKIKRNKHEPEKWMGFFFRKIEAS